MKNARLKVAPILVAVTMLAGCFAQLEGDSILVTQGVPVCDPDITACTFPAMPTTSGDLIVLPSDGRANMSVDIGDQDFFKPAVDFGPWTLRPFLSINSADIQINDNGKGDTFAEIEEMQLIQLRDPTDNVGVASEKCTPGEFPIAARFVRSASDTNPMLVTLKGTGINLVDLMAGRSSMTFAICARGVLPKNRWNAILSLDMRLKARGS